MLSYFIDVAYVLAAYAIIALDAAYIWLIHTKHRPPAPAAATEGALPDFIFPVEQQAPAPAPTLVERVAVVVVRPYVDIAIIAANAAVIFYNVIYGYLFMFILVAGAAVFLKCTVPVDGDIARRAKDYIFSMAMQFVWNRWKA